MNPFTLEFHTKFFPRLLWSRLRPQKKEQGRACFGPNIELMGLLALCGMLIAIGIPLAVNRGSVVGWALIFLGIAGILAILVFSIFAQLGTKPSYDNFLIGVFFFFVFLGLTVGLFIGQQEHWPFWGLLGRGVLGLFIGYIVGIFAGFWFQCFGWAAFLVDMAAGLMIIGMIIVDMVLCLK